MNTRAEFLAGGENGKVVVPGNAAKSRFIELISSVDADQWMPPEGPRVPTAKVAILRQWVNAGMVWEQGVRLGYSNWEPPLKPRQVELPP
ncbi:MAG: c-type cytochrome domain-containing protein, partial [Pirellulaceae bacterium]